MKHEIQAIIDKLSTEKYAQYEIRVMLQELIDKQDSPFVEDGLLAIPEEHIFWGVKDIEKIEYPVSYGCYVSCDNFLAPEQWKTWINFPDKVYIVDTTLILEGEKPMDTGKRLGINPIGE